MAEPMRQDGTSAGGEPTRLLSVVLPVFNEAAVIDATHRRVIAALDPLPGFALEIVYVDDGSRDETPALLQAIAAADPRVALVTFRRNFGHQAAVVAGLRQAAGDVIVVMDADLQDPPELVPAMIESWRAGHEVVYGVRRDRKESLPKRFAYDAFYRLLSRLAEVEIPRDAGDFGLIDRRALDAIEAMPERQRFVRGLRAWVGGPQIGLPYERAARAAGTTKYPLDRLIRLAFDGVFNFSVRPLRAILWLGLAVSLLAFAGLVAALAGWPAGGLGAGGTALLLLGGIQLLSLGIIGEYLGRVFTEVKQRPPYIAQAVRESRYGATRRR
ncbi:MAG: glycosyltransferase family 2 protein [Dongiaceae bacterium]